MKRIRTQPSSIHGRGLFAQCTIRKGTHLGDYEGERTMEDGDHVLWLDPEDGGYGIDGKNELRWVNHSTTPNAVFEGESLVALRSIEAGEEITHDYGWED